MLRRLFKLGGLSSKNGIAIMYTPEGGIGAGGSLGEGFSVAYYNKMKNTGGLSGHSMNVGLSGFGTGVDLSASIQTEKSDLKDVRLGEPALVPKTGPGVSIEGHVKFGYSFIFAIGHVDEIKQGINNLKDFADAVALPFETVIQQMKSASRSGIAISEDFTATFLLREEDPGIYVNTTTGSNLNISVGVDRGRTIGRGWYMGTNVEKLESGMFGGWGVSASVSPNVKLGLGLGLNVVVDVGLDNNNRPLLITMKAGGSVGGDIASPINVSLGGGYPTPMKKVF